MADRTIPTSALEVRQRLVDALRLDLVGPDETRPDLAEETLPEAPPSRWYLTGFLAPSTVDIELRSSDDPDDDEDLGGAGETEEETSEAESIVAASRPVFPSSIGVSVLVGPRTSALEITTSWGSYSPVEIPAKRRGDNGDDEESRPMRDWKRTPHKLTVDVILPENGRETIELAEPDGHRWGLRLTVLSREVPRHERTGLVEGTRAVSIFVENCRAKTSQTRDHDYAFQVGLSVYCSEGFAPRNNLSAGHTKEADAAVSDLQYRDLAEWAVGHGIATEADVQGGTCQRIHTRWIPDHAVPRVGAGGEAPSMLALAAATTFDAQRALLEPMLAEYGAWLSTQVAALADEPLSSQRRSTATRLHDQASIAAERIESGIALLARDDVRTAFCAMNEAMATAQRRRLGAPDAQPTWRAFQIAFVLMNLEGLVDRKASTRELAELIYFPTGGGKTEAYLGVASFAMFWRRLSRPTAYDGVSVLMRYTLRLLTLDQLGRAAGLVCAMELMRRQTPAIWGKRPFEIGLWVGGSTTPNKIGDPKKPAPGTAHDRVKEYKTNTKGSRPVPIEVCPWCNSELGRNSYTFTTPTPTRPAELRVVCPNFECEFSSLDADGLPMLLVDENVYDRTPAFVIATVDKFAQLCWTADSGRIVGRPRKNDEACLAPPDLFIQDELHLISGPLGTMVGAYELALDALATDESGVRVKTITATATVRRAEEQIRALYGRQVAVFPPRGVHRDDSYFANTIPVTREAGRLYVGVSAPGRSLKVVLLRVYAALLCAAQRIREDLKAAGKPLDLVDPYMTLLGYFSSLRELGGSRRIVEDEVSSRAASVYYARRRREEAEGDFVDRKINLPSELTSRVSTADISKAKQALGVSCDKNGSLDVALATNMISVGLDVARLGLMVVLGRPKTTSEYIQATSRVGRAVDRPGLVVTLFNPYRVRDRSHYERFVFDHEAFYRNVEAVSVTPFAARALDRAIAPVVVALARHTIERFRPLEGAGQMAGARDAGAAVVDLLRKQAQRALAGVNGADVLVNHAVLQADDVLDSWARLADEARAEGVELVYREGDRDRARWLLRDPLNADVRATNAGDIARMRAPWSLRDVEPSTAVEIRTGRAR